MISYSLHSDLFIVHISDVSYYMKVLPVYFQRWVEEPNLLTPHHHFIPLYMVVVSLAYLSPQAVQVFSYICTSAEWLNNVFVPTTFHPEALRKVDRPCPPSHRISA